jgi:hypothetical protein
MKNFTIILTYLIISFVQLEAQPVSIPITPQPREYYQRLQYSAVFSFSPNMGIVLESSQNLEIFALLLNKELKSVGVDTLKIYYDNPPVEISKIIYLGINSSKLNDLINQRETFEVNVTENYPGKEGYIIDIIPMNCVINASDSAGLYYAIKSFMQIVKGAKNGNIFACRVVDAPEFPIRWVYYPMNFLVDANVTKAKTQWQQFSDLKLNGAVCGDVKYDFITEMPKKYSDSLYSTRLFAQDRFFNFIPSIFSFGYSNSLMYFDPNFASGLPVNGQKFIIESDTARLIPSVNVTMPNGGLENHNGNNFPGFQFIDQPGVLSFADTDIKYSGNTSVRFEGFEQAGNNPNARVVYRTAVAPFKQYKISCAVRTENLMPNGDIRITVLNTKGKQLNYANTNVPTTTSGWKKIDVVINSLDNDTIAIYWGVWGARSGKIWWDDLSISELAFVNLLRREGTPLNVDNPLVDLIIREGVDFDTLRDPKLGKLNSWYGDFDTYHQPPKFKIKNNSIKNGDTLYMSYYHAITVYDGQVMVTMSDDNLYNQIEKQFKILDSILNPKYYFMNHDEIRTMNWDNGDLNKMMTPGQLLADNTIKCNNIIKKYNKNADIWDWSDMFDEFHNAVKKDYYLVNGDLTGSADLIDNNIGIVNWNSGKVQNSLNFFSSKGFRQIASPYYDTDENSIRNWKNNSRNTINFQGMMYTTWAKNYTYIPHFAEYAWNHAPYITHQPIGSFNNYQNISFTCTIEGDKYYKNWKIDNAALYYKTSKNADFTKINPSSNSGKEYTFTINLTEKPDYFCYYISADDKDGWNSKVPYGETQYYEYFNIPNSISDNLNNTNFQFKLNENFLIITNSQNIENSINIYNLSGDEIFQSSISTENEIIIPISIFKNGTYFIKIDCNQPLNKKILVVDGKIFFDK